MLLLSPNPIGSRGMKRSFEDSDDSDDWVPEDPSALRYESPVMRRPPRKLAFRVKPLSQSHISYVLITEKKFTSSFVGVIWEKGRYKHLAKNVTYRFEWKMDWYLCTFSSHTHLKLFCFHL